MKVGYYQNEPIFGNKQQNFKDVAKALEGITADLIVLPELFATGYTFTSKEEAEELAEDKNGLTANFLKGLSKETSAVIVSGFPEIINSKVYNSSIMVYQDEVIGTFQKIHLFNKEKLWFTPGENKLQVYEVKEMKIGMMVCFDWIFPEVTRTLALKGAQIIAHPCNLVLPYCQKAMTTRCIENRVFAITTNRIGKETRGDDDFLFTGQSQITSFNSEVLSSAPVDKTHLDFVEIDLSLSSDKMVNDYNDVLKDRRTDFYELGW
ncbi:MAG: hypothetical protein HRT72_07170 [Flavobacteriales bacterium]|nr:hypothetical protein [Flavobacteriales bacterium]